MMQGVSGLTVQQRRLVGSLLLCSGLSVAFYLLRIIGSGTNHFGFMLWNLCLAWLPLLFSTLLVRRLQHTTWLSWPNVLLSCLWLGFLPNSFYMITDFVHLQNSGEINVLFDTVMMVSFIFSGLVLGYTSLYQVHRELLKRLLPRRAHAGVGAVVVGVSFAIYLGRSLRWNTWDILTQPGGLIFDVSDRLIHPISYPEAVLTTVTFGLLIGVMYIVLWEVLGLWPEPSKSRP